jgi:hypothetical protein
MNTTENTAKFLQRLFLAGLFIWRKRFVWHEGFQIAENRLHENSWGTG